MLDMFYDIGEYMYILMEYSIKTFLHNFIHAKTKKHTGIDLSNIRFDCEKETYIDLTITKL